MNEQNTPETESPREDNVTTLPVPPAAPAPAAQELPTVGSPKRSHVKLNRAQRAEVRLAFMTITEAETRFKAATEAANVARSSTMSARSQALEAQAKILQELDLSDDNIVDVENLVVLPPKGESFVKGRNE